MPPKRRSGALAVPDITEDAAERKRVLNVLAQRRYRKRKKDRLQTLQAQVEKQLEETANASTDPLQPELQSPISNGVGKSIYLDNLMSSEIVLDQDLVDSDIQDALNLDTSSHLDFAPDIVSLPPPNFFSLLSTTSTSQPCWTPQLSTTNDTSTYMIPPPLQPPSQESPALDPPNEDNLFNWLTTQQHNAYNLSDQLQISESSTFTFPDDHIIEIPSLKLLNAAMQVAIRLNVAHMLWDITAISPFYKPPAQRTQLNSQFMAGIEAGETPSPPSLTSSSSVSSSSPHAAATPQQQPQPQEPPSIDITALPPHLQPTATQLHLPHHPLFDILPWPSTRTKLIQIFNLPLILRPKSAQDPLGILRLVYDMEDEKGEGIKIQGSDAFEEGNWEIGQVVFENWWWAFDSGVVDRSARGRRGRGEMDFVMREVG
ncbi:hypothetical protein BJY04DRAFT_221131 [Aspergillus karnatakaensis]|uniref:uncharacterized protein n=1 Tax=Aspergillus karnatakaensis TaxID=1810916 RepID=UPI003CCD9BB3